MYERKNCFKDKIFICMLTNGRYYVCFFFKDLHSMQLINRNNFILTNFACYFLKSTIQTCFTGWKKLVALLKHAEKELRK